MFLTVGVFAERWAVAAKEGLVIYMRGEPVGFTLPRDLVERMVDFVNHVLPVLALLVSTPGTTTDVTLHSFGIWV
jgi:hypothetical protein